MKNFCFKNVRYIKNDCALSEKVNVYVEENHIKKIVDAKNDENFKDADRVLDCENLIMTAGLSNLHAHLPMAIFKNVKSNTNLQDWLNFDVFPREKILLNNEDMHFYSAVLGIMEMLKNGITYVLDCYMKPEIVAKAVEKTGIRAMISVGYHSALEKADSKRLEKTINDIKEIDKNGLISFCLYFHSVYNSSERQISSLCDLRQKYSFPLVTHLAETLKEVGDCVSEHKKTPTKLLEELGFFDGKSLVAHGVYLDREDIELMKKYDTSIVTCPSSNAKLGSGICPYLSLQNSGVNLTIGTDGSFSNNSLDIIKEMQLATYLGRVDLKDSTILKSDEVFKFATTNAKKAVGLNIGEIKEGALADLVLFDISGLEFLSEENFIEQLIYSASSSSVYLTMVNGKVLYEDGKFYFLDEKLKYEDVLKKCKEYNKQVIEL